MGKTLARALISRGAMDIPRPDVARHDPRFARHADRTIHVFEGRGVEESALPAEGVA